LKDAKIYDGAGWQSLKGPPGPSTPSADAGNTLKLGTDALLFTTAPPDSNAYVWCKHGDNPQARYNLAKTLTPNGQPLSATNRATLLILPGTYAGSLAVDAQFVDVHAIGQETSRPSVRIGGINVTANDVGVSGIEVGGQFLINGLLPLQRFTNCTGGDFSFGGPDGEFGVGGHASGTFTNCTAGMFSFGAGSLGDYGTCNGWFENCTASSLSFGVNALVQGTFINCTGEADCFGSGGAGSGTFTLCSGGLNAFDCGPFNGNCFAAYCTATGGNFDRITALYCIQDGKEWRP